MNKLPKDYYEINHPKLVEEWSPKNGIPISSCALKSHKYYIWVCSNNTVCDCIHEWPATMAKRTREKPTGCPWCANHNLCAHTNLEYTHKHLIDEWDPCNEGSMSDYSPHSGKIVNWHCSKNTDCYCHEWPDSINHRTNEKNPRGCPFCAGLQLCDHNNLEALHEELIDDWHHLNEKPMKEYAYGSHDKVLWRCNNNNICACPHIYEASIANRTKLIKPRGCPFCAGKRLCPHTNLEALHKRLLIEWHPDNLKPMSDYPPSSNESALWICSNNKTCECHVWPATINSRTNKKNPSGCPFCNNNQVCVHKNLKTEYPKLEKEWNPNNKPMETYAPHSNEKVDWICYKNTSHIWNATISGRTSIDAKGCSQCSTNGFSKDQITWLTSIELSDGIYIQHACKPEGELNIHTIGKVDGYCKSTNTVYEYHGQMWHGDPAKYKRDDINPFNKKTYGELYDVTIDRDERIRALGYNLVIMWESEYLILKKNMRQELLLKLKAEKNKK